MEQRSLLDQLVAGFASAVADIRQKLVEEPWFGRVVTGGEHGTSTEGAQPERARDAPIDRSDQDGVTPAPAAPGPADMETDRSRAQVVGFMAAGYAPEADREREIGHGIER